MAFQETVERGAINARQTRGSGHVAGRSCDQARDVPLFKGRQCLLLRDGVRVARWQSGHSTDRGPEVDFLIERKLMNLNLRARLGEDCYVLDKILQLPHVATPRTRHKEIERVLGEFRRYFLRRS